MEIKDSKLENSRVKLEIEVNTERVNDEYLKVARDVQKKADIKGFRVGKAPLALVEKKYSDYIKKETAESIIRKAYIEAIEQKNYTPINQPVFDFENFEKDKPFSFTVEFDIPPTIEIGEYKNINVEQQVVEVTDDDVMAEIEAIRENMAKEEPKEEGMPAGKGDKVIIKMKRIDDKTDDEIEATEYTTNTLILGKSEESWAIDNDIIGMKKGEQKDIKVKYPKDYQVEELQGKKVVYRVIIDEIYKRILPEINDEFAKQTGKYESVEDMKAKIREEIEEYAKSQTLTIAKEDILEEIIEKSKFDIPQSMIDKEVYAIFRRLQSRFGNIGKDINEFASIFGMDPEKLYETMRDEAVKNIKKALILNKVAELEELKVSEEKFKEFVKDLAKRNQTTEEEIAKALEQNNSKEQVESDLLLNVAYDFLYENANVKKLKPISFQEFIKTQK